MDEPASVQHSDFEWLVIEPLLSDKPRGVPRVDDPRVLNGIYRRLRTGSPRADIPERHGSATICYNRFVRWRKPGAWDRLFEAVAREYEREIRMVDSASIRATSICRQRQEGWPAGCRRERR